VAAAAVARGGQGGGHRGISFVEYCLASVREKIAHFRVTWWAIRSIRAGTCFGQFYLLVKVDRNKAIFRPKKSVLVILS